MKPGETLYDLVDQSGIPFTSLADHARGRWEAAAAVIERAIVEQIAEWVRWYGYEGGLLTPETAKRIAADIRREFSSKPTRKVAGHKDTGGPQ